MAEDPPTVVLQSPGNIGSTRSIQAVAGSILIVLATLVVYGPALPGGVLWDDDFYISDNPLLVAEDGLWRIWFRPGESPQYYPLVFTTFWLEARLWGLSTLGVHVLNALLHALNALLLWHVLRRLDVPGAWLAGALFALHPVNVESVAWMTERKNVLSGLFFLLSVTSYLRFADHRRWRFYVAALLLFIGALLSKTAACFLPVVLFLILWWKRPRLGSRETLELVAFVAVGLAFGLHTVIRETYDVGAHGEEWALTWLQHVLLANRALWFYVGKLLWPANLVFNYPRWTMEVTAWWQYIFPVLTIIAVALMWGFRRQIGKASLAAVGCFVAGLAPVLGFFDVYYFRYSYVADHFQYHAAMAFIALLAALLIILARRLALGPSHVRQSLARAPFILPVVYGLLAYHQAGLYTDVETLWRRTIVQNPEAWMAQYNLALILVRDKENDDAAVEEGQQLLHRVLDAKPSWGQAHVALGNIASRRGSHEEAMGHYRAAVRIDPSDKHALYNMARELARIGDLEGAIGAYGECLEHDSAFAPAHIGLGRLLLDRGDLVEAEAHFRQALAADPRNVWALHNLGVLAESAGRYAQAIEHYAAALAVNQAMPDSWFRAGVCARTVGDLDAAELAHEKVLELDPDHAQAFVDLADIDAARGAFEQAARRYRRALDLNPGDARPREGLARAYRNLSRYADAAAVLEEGLLIIPQNLSMTHHLATLLATCPDLSLRDGERALELAKRVMERADPPEAKHWGTLAAAYAEQHEYEQATDSAQVGLKLAHSAGLEELEKRLSEQLCEYRRKTGPLEPP